jgi:hypothetical protein
MATAVATTGEQAAVALAMATAVAATMATAMATTGEQAAVAVATAIASRAATRAAAARASAVARATATMTSDRLAGSAHEGQTHHREENRDAKNQCTIHPRILQKQQVPYRKGLFELVGRPRHFRSPYPDDRLFGRDQLTIL